MGTLAILHNSCEKTISRVENAMETHFSLKNKMYLVHGNITAKGILKVHYVITHSLLSANMEFDGNTSLVGKDC
jgi:hypothetical protein